MDYLFQTYVIVVGFLIGSFLNVVIYRLPKGKMFSTARSVCPTCNTQLKWYHNVPVLSYIGLLGKCAFCKAPISYRYPLVEILNGLAYAWLFNQHGWGLDLLPGMFLVSALIAIFFIDLDHQIIPDSITLPGIGFGLLASFLPGHEGIVSALIGTIVGGGALLLIALLGDWLFKKESMGGGDIKMAAMLGAFLGWQQVVFVFIAAAMIGVIASVILMIISARMRQERVIPFGPFLASAAVVALTYGDQIIEYYRVNFLGL